MTSAARVTRKPPELRNGDHMDVAEFERRYAARPDIKKAELIEGRVYVPSPVTIDSHGSQHGDLVTWLGHYRAFTPGVQMGDNSTVKLPGGMNEPQPDACLRIRPEYGGQTATDGGYVAGAPELVAEVAGSSLNYDLHDKLHAYEYNGVREYVVWRVEDEAIDWFVLRDGKFHAMSARGDARKSKVFPGLWLDVPAMLRGDLAKVLRVVQRGIAAPEHKRFVARLGRQTRKRD